MLLERLTHWVDISTCGAYSSSRRAALAKYQEETSTQHALLVCLLTPLPAFVFVVALEALPLAPVSEGLWKNPVLVARFCCCAIVISFCVVSVVLRFIPTIRVRRRQLWLPAVATGILHTGVIMVYVELWTFPLPFTTAQTSIPFMMILTTVSYVTFGKKPIEGVTELGTKLKRALAIMYVVTTATFVYPAFAMLFRALVGPLQYVALVLPITFKLGLKAIVAQLCRSLECGELVPETAHCGVEASHAMFVMTCLQAANEPMHTLLVILLSDFLPLVRAYRSVRTLLYDPTIGPSSLKSHSSSVRIMPSHPVEPSTPHRISETQEAERLSRALFAIENHLLIEYIECAIPLAYTTYVAVLFHLPNAKYYPLMDLVSTEHALMSYLRQVLVLVTLQCFSMVAFARMLSRQHPAISCLHQLAFVLETQASAVQVWMFMWVPFCILSSADHTGNDYTLKFAWIHGR